jgi:hypothetical protein
LHVIGNHAGNININFQVVDFTSIFTMPYRLLNDFKIVQGNPRLRLNTPHREYLNQRFGSFYSRIGLPNEDHISEENLLGLVNDDRREHTPE